MVLLAMGGSPVSIRPLLLRSLKTKPLIMAPAGKKRSSRASSSRRCPRRGCEAGALEKRRDLLKGGCRSAEERKGFIAPCSPEGSAAPPLTPTPLPGGERGEDSPPLSPLAGRGVG